MELSFLLSGVLLGLVAGISSGPLFALVISETLRGGLRSGLKVAVVPLTTDFPLVLISVLLFSRLDEIHFLLGVFSLLGAAFLFYLAYENIKIKQIEIEQAKQSRSIFLKGFVTNVLNPHPYIFFLTVGGTCERFASKQTCGSGVCGWFSMHTCRVKSHFGAAHAPF